MPKIFALVFIIFSLFAIHAKAGYLEKFQNPGFSFSEMSPLEFDNEVMDLRGLTKNPDEAKIKLKILAEHLIDLTAFVSTHSTTDDSVLKNIEYKINVLLKLVSEQIRQVSVARISFRYQFSKSNFLQVASGTATFTSLVVALLGIVETDLNFQFPEPVIVASVGMGTISGMIAAYSLYLSEKYPKLHYLGFADRDKPKASVEAAYTKWFYEFLLESAKQRLPDTEFPAWEKNPPQKLTCSMLLMVL